VHSFEKLFFLYRFCTIRLRRINYCFATRPKGEKKRLAANIRLLRASHGEPHFARAESFRFSGNAVENAGKSTRRGAERRGGRTTTSNLAPNSERNPNFFQGKSASGFGLNPTPRFRPPDGEQNRKIFSQFF